MAAKLKIQDGNPVWLSPSIVPSKDTVVSPTSTPTTSAIKPTSTDVFVYVKVENTGTVDLGSCTCPIGPWTTPTFFPGFFASVNGSTSQSQGGFTFNATSFGDSISGSGVNFNFGLVASGRRAWAWSPDGRLFAYAGSPNGSDWFLTIVALQAITRSNGTTVNMLPSEGLAKQCVALPPAELVARFDDIVRPMLDQQETLVAESRTLADLRDALLPKLLSGEVLPGKQS